MHVSRLALAAALFALPAVGLAAELEPVDDSIAQRDLKFTKAIAAQFGLDKSADAFPEIPSNSDPATGLRILPPTGTQLISGQKFDLRVETQVPAAAAPKLKSLVLNGADITGQFSDKIVKQGAGPESGTPASPLLYGATARNMAFELPGKYTVVATVSVDGVDRTITNVYAVAPGLNLGKDTVTQGPKHIVFFLGDALGNPVRTAARIISKGVIEGRTQGKLNMDRMDSYAFVQTASFDSVITDSAPGMANYVTGMKQPNNGLNVSVDNTPESNLDNPRIETLFEYLKRVGGFRTGVVTDAFVTDATPAAVAAHTRARSNRTAIAQQFVGYLADGTDQPRTGYTGLAQLVQPLDVIIGSGAVDWLKNSNTTVSNFYQYAPGAGRKDIDLAAVAPGLGYTVARNLDELNAAPTDRKLLGLWTGEFRTTSSGLGTDNVPGVLDRLVARGKATIRGKDAGAPELGLNVAPPRGTGCGATVGDCFRNVPSKKEAVSKAISVLNGLAGADGNWILLVEQSQTDKLGHPLEYERVLFEALELDETVGYVQKAVLSDKKSLALVTADHAQPETIIGVVLTTGITPGGATPPGGCFSGASYPLTLGSAADPKRPCALQDAIGTFNDGTFPTYADADHNGYPDDSDPAIKLVLEDGGRPTYATTFLTNYQPLNPAADVASLPNPARQPDGLLMTGNMPTRNVPGGANHTNGNTTVAPHSGDDVPLSAQGRGARLFSGVLENTDVHVRLAAAVLGLEGADVDTLVPNVAPPPVALKGF